MIIKELRRRARQIVLPVLGTCVVVYFVYHTIQGDRGLRAYVELEKEVDEARAVLAALNVKRNLLQRKVDLLHAESPNHDLLEERARVILNAAHENDVIVLIKQ